MAEPLDILVVDDEPDMCWALENILQSEGYRVTTVSNARDALDTVREGRFSVALIDAKLPDMDGIELATRVRHDDAGLAIILISGYFYPEDKTIEEGLQCGVYSAFISKPFDIHQVRAVVRKAIE